MAVSAVAVGLVILMSILLVSSVFRRARKNRERLMPPGPSPWPVIGNLHQIGNLPHRTLQQLAEKYGPIMSLRLGSIPTVVVSSSQAAKQFLKTHDLIFASRPYSACGKYIFYNQKDLAFAHYGGYWREMRKICVLELLTPKRIESFKFVWEEEAAVMIRSIWAESRQGRVAVNVSKRIASFVSDVVCRIVIGRSYGDNDLSGTAFKGMLEEVALLMGCFNIGDFIPCLGWLDMQGFNRRMKNVHNLLDGVIEKIIEQHVEARQEQKEKRKYKDLVDVLLDTDMQITRDDMKAIITDMIVAAIETNVTTIEWAMSEILRNHCVMKKLQRETGSLTGIDEKITEFHLLGMNYLNCVVKETLRLYPAGPLLIPHESTQSCNVGGPHHCYFIPKKTRLIVNAWAIGRDSSVWEDPLEFKPERFMNKEFDIMKDQDLRMIPFGSGRRGCPGGSIAIYTIQTALAHLLHYFDWNIKGELNMDENFGIAIPKKEHLFAFPTWRLKTKVPSFVSMD